MAELSIQVVSELKVLSIAPTLRPVRASYCFHEFILGVEKLNRWAYRGTPADPTSLHFMRLFVFPFYPHFFIFIQLAIWLLPQQNFGHSA